MSLFNKTPAWVKNLPDDDSNKALLIKIASVSKRPISAPREINFAINDIAAAEDAQEMSAKATSAGWQCRIVPDHSANHTFWLEAQKQGYCINKENLYADELFFERLAKLYGASYDGWYAAAS